ncbi:retinol dehydrogenase 12 [Lingula anatina]|uniref:Retinol dehydrogenase 12 n=1 Tax=Lingula anatina TaxID=7574 RepID=A0A1S3J5B5_LINAN|nr:retinol dehydrogenase 12 [Lingula anatina]XP_013405570.1 retinol dehydrogenase 12 [Lingula anatina]XP_013405571.1 retinol dehydrogenase 12 [Lingula anatina]XP_013405572.1 retinol dehydrogenase 12 [Lingula anatina]XP_013405573.1 retinol dehydrogenase 12 [Lingula anatina]|eukprot:XP_013405569.1 retinol dehydrogenase 12 [Lingula anatina]
MTGRVIIVTGANSGIGYEVARYLCEGGNNVILACRDETKGNDAVQKIQSENPHALATFMQLNLSSMESIRKFVEDFHATKKKLHVLVCNAGVCAAASDRVRKETADKFELTMGTNHLGHFLLTNLLLDDLKKAGAESGDARVVMVTSEAHNMDVARKRNPPLVPLDMDNFMLTKYGTYNSMQAYKDSKLANVMFAYELAKQLEGTGVTANAVCPAANVPTTNFLRNENMVQRFFMKWVLHRALRFTHTTRTIGQAAQAVVNAATNEELKGVTGKYFLETTEHQSSAESLDEEVQKKLWNMSAGLVKLEGYDPIEPPEAEAPPPPPEPVKKEEKKEEGASDAAAKPAAGDEKPAEAASAEGEKKGDDAGAAAEPEKVEETPVELSQGGDTTADTTAELSTTVDDSSVPPESSFAESGCGDTTTEASKLDSTAESKGE